MRRPLIKRRFIEGKPYAHTRVRGDPQAAAIWSEDIVRQTSKMPKVTVPCELRVVFILPSDRYPRDYPYGPDLDNYVKRFQDALNITVFSDAQGKDSCVVRLYAEKRKAENNDKPGAWFEIYQVR